MYNPEHLRANTRLAPEARRSSREYSLILSINITLIKLRLKMITYMKILPLTLTLKHDHDLQIWKRSPVLRTATSVRHLTRARRSCISDARWLCQIAKSHYNREVDFTICDRIDGIRSRSFVVCLLSHGCVSVTSMGEVRQSSINRLKDSKSIFKLYIKCLPTCYYL